MVRLANTKKALLGGCLTGLKGGVKEGKEENLQPLVYEVSNSRATGSLTEMNLLLSMSYIIQWPSVGGVKRFIGPKGDGIFDTPASLKRAVA